MTGTLKSGAGRAGSGGGTSAVGQPPAASDTRLPALLGYLLAGIYLGVVLTKGEAISWFRIQEMFRFQSFHMYGIFATAIPVAAVGVWLLKRLRVHSLTGERISLPPKQLRRGTRYWAGGATFGVGWALTGACPGPLFALVGAGIPVFLLAIASALLGTWVYGQLRPRLPH
jgi:uncharacterized protein